MLKQNHFFTGLILALIAVLFWSGNFIIAKHAVHSIPPVSLSFFRWITATVFIFPFCIHSIRSDLKLAYQHKVYFLFTGLFGVTLFNTLVYIAGHYTTALNLSIIGTTSSPVFSIILAALFLRERIPIYRIIGVLICIFGILYLIASGQLHALKLMRLNHGDVIVLFAAFSFSVYNTMIKKRPARISDTGFLWIVFTIGTLLLLPFYIAETITTQPVQWNPVMIGSVLYLGIGASVISFFCWNASVMRLGASRTALFGNLIPLFSALGAVVLLNETITSIHLYSAFLILTGLFIANLDQFLRKKKPANS